jgi:hypothetical protein
VWWQAVCDDAVTAASGSSVTVTVDGGGARGAHDKLFQDNSHGRFIIQNFYGERLGKMYRACGVGGACTSTVGNLTITNTIAIGVDEIVGIPRNRDTATLSHICVFQTPTICQPYDSDNKIATDGNDGTTCNTLGRRQVVLITPYRRRGPRVGLSNYFKSSAPRPPAPPASPISRPASSTARREQRHQAVHTCLSRSYSCKGCSDRRSSRRTGLDPWSRSRPRRPAPSIRRVVPDGVELVHQRHAGLCLRLQTWDSQTANTVWDCVNPWY